MHRVTRTFLVFCLLAGLGVSVPAPTLALSFSGFKSGMVDFLLEKVSVPGQFEVKADEVVRAGPGATELAGVRISDGQGEWFFADRFVLEWSPSRLIRGEVQIDTLRLAGGRLDRLPEVPADAAPKEKPDEESNDSVSDGWPRSPIAVAVREIQIESLQIADAVVPGGITLKGNGAFEDEGDVQAAQFTVQRIDKVAGKIAIALKKHFVEDTLKVSLSANEAADGLVARLSGLPRDVPVALSVDGNGTPAAWEGTLALRAEEVATADGRISAAWADRLAIDFTGDFRPGKRLDAGIRRAIGEQAAIRFRAVEDAASRVRIEAAEVRSDALIADAMGWFDRAAEAVDVKVTGQVSEDGARRLGPLMHPLAFQSASFEANATGPLDALAVTTRATVRRPSSAGFSATALNVNGQMTTEGDARPLALRLVITKPASGERDLSSLGDEVVGRLDGRLTKDRLSLSALRLDAGAVSAQVDGDVLLDQATTLALRYQLAIPEAARIRGLTGLDAQGALSASGRITGTAAAPRIAGAVNGKRVVVNGESLGAIDLAHDLRAGDNLDAKVDLTIDGPTYGKGTASTRVRQRGTAYALKPLAIDLLGIRGNGAIDWSPTLGPDGAVDVAIVSLAPLGRLSGLELSGTGEGQARFTRTDQGSATFALRVADVTLPDVSLTKARLEGKIAQLQATPTFAVTLDASEIGADAANLQALAASVNGPLDALTLDIKARGDTPRGAFTADTQATADLEAATRRIVLERLKAVFAEEAFELVAPATITLTPATGQQGERIGVAGLALSLPQSGRLAVDSEWSPTALTATVKGTDVPLGVANLFVDSPVESGRVNLDADIATAASAPRLNIRADVAELALRGAPPEVRALTAELTTDWEGSVLRTNAAVAGDFGDPVAIEATLPVAATQTWLPELNQDGPLNARVNWTGELERLFALLPLPDHLVTGKTVLDVRVAGTVATPKASGELSISEGRYENLLTGTLIEDLRLDTDFRDGESVEFKARGTDGIQGTLDVRGRVDGLADTAGPRIEVVSKFIDMWMVRMDAATAQMGGDVKVSGTPLNLDVLGTIDVQRAEIRLLNNLPASVVDLGPVEVVGAPKDETKPESGGEAEVRLDVAVRFPDRIFIRGRGLDSEWGGNLNVAGTAAAPTVTGKIEARRGQLDLIGRVFELDRGSIVFGGGKSIDPAVGILLVREANGMTGRIGVEGTASEPELVFSSTPAVPEDEVLARVLFGRGSANLSGSEALQLAAGIAALTSGEAGVVDNIRSSLGVDVLRIESGDGEGSSSSASVGRYVYDGVYVGARQTLDGQTGSVVVELEVIDDVVIDADLGYSGESSAGVTWRKDF